MANILRVIIVVEIILILLIGWLINEINCESKIQKIKLGKMKSGDTVHVHHTSYWELSIIDSIKGDTIFYHSSSLKNNFKK